MPYPKLFAAELALLLCLITGCSRAPVTPLPTHPSSFSASTPSHRFVDVAAEAGIHYQWHIDGPRPLDILQTIGNGCAFLDYDNDGNLDIFLVGPHPALYRGDGHGHFTDVTHPMGLDKLTGHFLGCAVGDYDNDGYDDIYLSGYRTGVLLHNENGKKFQDATHAAGLKPQPWGTACAFAETEPGSGRLDLFVANYARFGYGDDIPRLCSIKGVMTSCPPRNYLPIKGIFYKNRGQGRFVEVTGDAGMKETNGRALGAAFAPLDGSRQPYLTVANDELPGDLLQPHGRGSQIHYTNIGMASGTAMDRDGRIHGGMGVDWGDYDNDGRLDLFVSTFQTETKALYHNEGRELFTEISYPVGLAQSTLPRVAFGCKFFDFDNDGWLDLMIANGHIQDNIQQIDADATFRQATQLFHNKGVASGAFEDFSQTSGLDLQKSILGRGLAIGDFDNDGREDALVVDSEGKPMLLHNQTSPSGHWLAIKLVGSRSNRDGYGAMLTATLPQSKLVRLCHTDGSYLSASDSRVHFGLGSNSTVEKLTIQWPSGTVDVLKNVHADRIMLVREGSAK